MGVLLLLALRFAPVEPAAEVFELRGRTMGTRWSVQISSSEIRPSSSLATAISSQLHSLDREVFSTYSPTSELSRLNQAPVGAVITVSAPLLEVLSAAIQLHTLSGGAFDITVGPLVNLWGFGPDQPQGLPTDEEIFLAMQHTGIEDLQLNPTDMTATRMSDISLDLSGIAKGYAVDVIARQLEAAGVADYLVEIGGELRVKGTKADRSGWQIAIEDPDEETQAPFLVLPNKGQTMAMAGSGNYRNYREIAGQRYSHEIDPRTGAPVTHSLAAVTIVGESAMLADAWATALMVQGPEAGLEMANSLGLAAYFIIHENQGLVGQSSHSFQERFSR